MKDSNKLLHQAQQKIQTSSAATKTPAGLKDYEAGNTHNADTLSAEKPISAELIDAVTHVFAQFELVYHNQYSKAFASADKEKLAKRLWLNHLRAYQPQAILRAADLAIRSSEYLPSVYSVLKFIGQDSQLPSTRDAYYECCHAGSPKAQQTWSHPIVYWAGKACGWHVLATYDERHSYAIFKEKYEALCARLNQGQQFSLPALKNSPYRLAQPESEQLPRGDAGSTLTELKNLFKHI